MLIINYDFLKVETFVNKTFHQPNWDMSQSQKIKTQPITHINNSDNTIKQKQKQKRKNFARCIGIPMGKVELAQFVRSKKRNGGSFSSHFQWFYSILFYSFLLNASTLLVCFCSWFQTKVGMKCLFHQWVFKDLCQKVSNKLGGWF